MAKAKSTTAVPAGERSKRDAFVKLAKARTTKAVSAIRALANLAGPSYDYTPEDVQTMEEVFKRELSATFGALKSRKKVSAVSVVEFK